MKHLKLFEDFNDDSEKSKTVELGSVTHDGDWEILKVDSYDTLKHILDNFYQGKKWLHNENGFDIYYWEHTDWDKDEDEPFWYKKMAIAINPREFIVKTKTLEEKPLYSIRDEKNGMTRKQELRLRTWIGTSKRPKIGKLAGGYFGMENGFALMRSPHSGTIFKIDKDGEMYYNDTGEKLGE
jgi:hypothetical protein